MHEILQVREALESLAEGSQALEGTRQLHLPTSGSTAVRRARVICEEHLAVPEPVGRSR